MTSETTDMLSQTYEEVVQNFRRNSYKSNYGVFYGRKSDLADVTDIEILKNKTFSQLECAFPLTQECKEILGKAHLYYFEINYIILGSS